MKTCVLSRPLTLGILGAVLLSFLGGCWTDHQQQVVVYTALDREFSQPIFDQFQRQTGITVLGKFDTESTKTVGLFNAIIAESARPRCDVFWNNEILNTLRLKNRGLLAPYDADGAQFFPPSCVDSEKQWFGFAARARVLLVNTEQVPKTDYPTSVMDLAAPQWKDQAGIAKPLFGTTATHAAVLFDCLGTEAAEEFFTKVNQNALVLSGNKQVAMAVARGQLKWGLTDTDDAMIEIEKGLPVEIVYPDQAAEQLGTLFIPNCVAIIKGSPHQDAAQKLVEFLLTAPVETALAAGPSAQIPMRENLQESTRVLTPADVKALPADFPSAAMKWDIAAKFLSEKFAQ